MSDRPLAMVYGGGGPFGIAYGAGVAMGLQAAGIDVHTAPALGTSAGSWVASIMALGLGYDDIASLDVPAVPTRRPGVVAELTRVAFGDARHPLVSASAFRTRGGRRGRVILRGSDHDLADICAASSSAPRLLPPHDVDGATYIDGGVRSITSVGCASPARHVIVVAPMARGVAGVGGAIAQRQLDRERLAWCRRNPHGDHADTRARAPRRPQRQRPVRCGSGSARLSPGARAGRAGGHDARGLRRGSPGSKPPRSHRDGSGASSRAATEGSDGMSVIDIEREDGLVTLTFDRPELKNALNRESRDELRAAWPRSRPARPTGP